jgi:chromosome segregation protein
MYLKRLEIQGFKTFAQKTVLEFHPDASGRRGVTGVVGPNGSGKSNIADAIRWVMGEQSLKLLRGKKSEDVIFSGSEKRSRSGFAEVTMIMENDLPSHEASGGLALGEIAVTRRLYRDGQSEYEVNKQAARLSDVALLLAQCGIGQRTYSVIGQGMVDAVLVASPAERKEFFDEAFGLRPFQLKRTSALNKIDDSKKNLAQTEQILNEIGPRLNTLERQVKRLAERDTVEKELRALERAWYGHEWKELSSGLSAAKTKLDQAQGEQAKLEKEAQALEAELSKMEKGTPRGEGFKELRAALDAVAAERAGLRERELKVETKKAVAAVRAEKPWSPLPLSKIIETVDGLRDKHDQLAEELEKKTPDIDKARKLATALRETSQDLVSKLQRPAPEVVKEEPMDKDLERELNQIAEESARLNQKAKDAEAALEAWSKQEDEQRSGIFQTQHKLQEIRSQSQVASRKSGEVSVEIARLETRRDGLLAELRLHAPQLESELDVAAKEGVAVTAEAPSRLQKLRTQLEWIGGIDPETVKEHGEIKERYEFLTKQVDDLRQGIQGLETVVAELDETIRGRSARAFRSLDKEFGSYFKKLFNGGEASLIEVQPEPETDEEGNIISEPKEGEVAGIDIMATPPGKRAKSIALLSGGERALTSIALICAIMSTNPSPFVVLDEVDAALDESNSRKFAEIIGTLSDKTQFVVVTHNRATMSQANVLYGVTMGDDSVSQLLSVDFEQLKPGKE